MSSPLQTTKLRVATALLLSVHAGEASVKAVEIATVQKPTVLLMLAKRLRRLQIQSALGPQGFGAVMVRL